MPYKSYSFILGFIDLLLQLLYIFVNGCHGVLSLFLFVCLFVFDFNYIKRCFAPPAF